MCKSFFKKYFLNSLFKFPKKNKNNNSVVDVDNYNNNNSHTILTLSVLPVVLYFFAILLLNFRQSNHLNGNDDSIIQTIHNTTRYTI